MARRRTKGSAKGRRSTGKAPGRAPEKACQRPSTVAGRPNCPPWLDADAKSLWRYIVPLLEEMNVLTRVDRNALGRYCQTYSRWKKAEIFLQKHGEIFPLKDEKGQVRCFMPWPQVSSANKLGQALLRLEQEFGLTPSARTRIEPSGQRPADDEETKLFLKLVSGGGPAPPRPGYERKSG